MRLLEVPLVLSVAVLSFLAGAICVERYTSQWHA